MARRLTAPQLIGPQHELAVLHSALADVAAGGEGRLALIEGDAGVGKSRLIEAFAADAASTGAIVLSGSCVQVAAEIPYASPAPPPTNASISRPNDQSSSHAEIGQMPVTDDRVEPTEAALQAHFDAIASRVRRCDADTMIELIRRATGEEPHMWGSIVGFGQYHYQYASGREGDAPAAGFAARKTATTVYVSDGVSAHDELLERLGPLATGVGCIYIKDLTAVDLEILETIVARSFATLTTGTYMKQARLALVRPYFRRRDLSSGDVRYPLISAFADKLLTNRGQPTRVRRHQGRDHIAPRRRRRSRGRRRRG